MSDYFGLYKGIVVDNNDPNSQGRIKCQIPKILGEAVSTWIPPQVTGPILKQAIGQIVTIQFIDGDLSQPVFQGTAGVSADQITGGTMTGANIQTAASGQRWLLQSTQGRPNTYYGGTFGNVNTIYGFSGYPSETTPAKIVVDNYIVQGGVGVTAPYASLTLSSPVVNGGTNPASISLRQYGTPNGAVWLTGGIYFNPWYAGDIINQAPLNQLGFGSSAVATGGTMINHNLNRTPTTILITVTGTNVSNPIARVDQRNSGQFRVWVDTAGMSGNVDWVALA